MTEYPRRDAVIEAINASKMSMVCEACGHQNWMVPSKSDQPEMIEVMMLVKPDNITSGFAFAPMICLSCGNTRMLNLETLMKVSPNG